MSGGLVESEIRLMTECRTTLATALDVTSGSSPLGRKWRRGGPSRWPPARH